MLTCIVVRMGGGSALSNLCCVCLQLVGPLPVIPDLKQFKQLTSWGVTTEAGLMSRHTTGRFKNSEQQTAVNPKKEKELDMFTTTGTTCEPGAIYVLGGS